MANDATAGGFKISDAPLASSAPSPEREWNEELPSHYEQPLLLALASDPRTLFVCWSVNWSAVFADQMPADRKAHVKVKSGDTERSLSVEPLRGACSMGDLDPGKTYLVEIGYYAPPDRWNVIVSGPEVMMPLPGGTDREPVEVATVPFHLSFQRMVDLFGGEKAPVRGLAEWERRMAQELASAQSDDGLLRALDLSREDLQTAAAMRESLAKIRTRPQAAELFGSSVGSSWGAGPDMANVGGS